MDWVSLGPSLDLIQQRLLIGGATFSLLAPRDVDAVIDLYLDLGRHRGGSEGGCAILYSSKTQPRE